VSQGATTFQGLWKSPDCISGPSLSQLSAEKHCSQKFLHKKYTKKDADIKWEYYCDGFNEQ
jgi:hypothetical protein